MFIYLFNKCTHVALNTTKNYEKATIYIELHKKIRNTFEIKELVKNSIKSSHI